MGDCNTHSLNVWPNFSEHNREMAIGVSIFNLTSEPYTVCDQVKTNKIKTEMPDAYDNLLHNSNQIKES